MAGKAIDKRLQKHKCLGCDHPAWVPSKRYNPKTMCRKCRKASVKRKKVHTMREPDIPELDEDDDETYELLIIGDDENADSPE